MLIVEAGHIRGDIRDGFMAGKIHKINRMRRSSTVAVVFTRIVML